MFVRRRRRGQGEEVQELPRVSNPWFPGVSNSYNGPAHQRRSDGFCKMTRNKFIELLKNTQAADFVHDRIIETLPFAFSDGPQFLAWRRVLSGILEVDPSCILVVGSGATGFSLNPKKGFAAFRKTSDIDTAIVSPYHFESAWRQLRRDYVGLNLRHSTAMKAHKSHYVFHGVIDTRHILAEFDFGKQWIRAKTEMAVYPPTDQHPLNFRLYRDFEALRLYHEENVKALQTA